MTFNKYHADEDLRQFSFLVTGGAGFIGSHIVEYLVQYGAGKIRILDNLSTGNKANIYSFLSCKNVEFIEGDICSYETCLNAMDGINFVSHQAALGSVPRSIDNPIITNEVNVNGFLNVLSAAKEINVKRMVYASSSSTYGDSLALPKCEEVIGNQLSPYAVSKFINELYAGVFSRVYGFHSIGLRYFNVFGPKQDPNGRYATVIPLFIKAILNNERPVINGNGETSRDFTFVSNVVKANLKSLFKPNLSNHEIYNIACGKQTSLVNLIDSVNSYLGKNILPEFKEFRKGDVLHSLANIKKAEIELDFSPEVSFTEGIIQTISFFKEMKTT